MRMDENEANAAGNAPLANDLLCGAQAIAEFIGVNRAMVYRMVENDRIPYFRKGQLLFARKSEIEANFRSEAA
jgi:helix-turn-helix protein